MKREIKFRAWDVRKKNMIYFFNPIFMKRYNSFNFLFSNNFYDLWYSNDKLDSESYDYYEPMQYTGLKDKNGKEIYEGDWCRAEYRTREGIITVQGNIVFDEFMWCVDCKNDIFSINRLHNFEVIGNIYENPELLGKEVTK